MVDITKRHGQRIEEPSLQSKLSIDPEGTSDTLPFFLHSLEALSRCISFDDKTKKALEEVSGFHRVRVPLFYLNLMDRDNPSCPVRHQAVPSVLEMEENGQEDPLAENAFSITPALIKRHPNRAVFLATSQCAMYCRFCNRKRLVGKGWKPEIYREESLQRIEEDPDIREIIISGGDPFMLPSHEMGDYSVATKKYDSHRNYPDKHENACCVSCRYHRGSFKRDKKIRSLVDRYSYQSPQRNLT